MNCHPAANLFPMMNARQFEMLKADIEKHGLLEVPVVDAECRVVDGRNRWKACDQLGIEFVPDELHPDVDPWEYVLKVNLHRRHLITSEKVMCAAKLPALENGVNANKAPQICRAYSAEQAAAVFGVSARSVATGRYVLAHGASWLVSLCEQGKAASTAAKFIELCGGKNSKAAQSEAVKGADDKWKAVRDYIATSKPKREQAEEVTINLPDNADEGTVAAVERWLERQDQRPVVERFRALWEAADEIGRAAIVAIVLDMSGD